MATLSPVSESILQQVQADVKDAMKAKDKERTGALRMIANALQNAAKEGNDDEIAVLQGERKRRLEAAEVLSKGGRDEAASAEQWEAEMIAGYLPAQLSDDELEALVADAVSESGATEAKDRGNVMKALMPKVGGRADGKRVSAAVREKLAS
jgi:uncharacterized protein YqeY